MHLDSAVLAEGVGELEGIELHVRISVCQPLDHGSHCIFGARVGRPDLITDILRDHVSTLLTAGMATRDSRLAGAAASTSLSRETIRGMPVLVCIPSSRSSGSRRSLSRRHRRICSIARETWWLPASAWSRLTVWEAQLHRSWKTRDTQRGSWRRYCCVGRGSR